MNLKSIKYLFAFLALVLAFYAKPIEAGIWVRPLSVKQGEIIIVSGLFYPFGNSFSFLSDCNLSFNNKKYTFAREIISYETFRNSGGTAGFQFITRLPTTPLTKVGSKKAVLECPLGKQEFNLNVLAGDFPIQNITLTPSKNSLTASETEKKAVESALNTFSPYKLWDSSKVWVLPNKAKRSSGYGLRRTYNGKLAENYFHKGLDFAAFTGSPIVAPAKGKVILAGKGFAVHGNCLFIDHGQGVISAYLHLSSIDVQENQEVEAGQLLGKVGDTGIATGPHLHFGIYVNGENVNPEPWLKLPMP